MGDLFKKNYKRLTGVRAENPEESGEITRVSDVVRVTGVASSGQVPVWNGSEWTAGTVSSSGGGGGPVDLSASGFVNTLGAKTANAMAIWTDNDTLGQAQYTIWDEGSETMTFDHNSIFNADATFQAGDLNTQASRFRVGIGSGSADGFTISNIHYYYLVTAGAISGNLPATPRVGQVHCIKDALGEAWNNDRIYVHGNGKLIDGDDGFYLDSAYQAVTVVYNGTQWNRVNELGFGSGGADLNQGTIPYIYGDGSYRLAPSTFAQVQFSPNRFNIGATLIADIINCNIFAPSEGWPSESISSFSAPVNLMRASLQTSGNLTATPSPGHQVVIKDAEGAAVASGGLIIHGNGKNIDGQPYITLTSNYQSVTLMYDSTPDAWFIL